MKLSFRNESAQTGSSTDSNEELIDKRDGTLHGITGDEFSVPP